MSTKFTLYNFTGNPVSHWIVEAENLDRPAEATKQEKSETHNIVIVDRSGSMYGDIDSLKQMLEKLLTLDEYQHSEMRVSLISYASSGDCTLHFERVPVREVMKTSSPQLQSIRRLYSSGCTGMSQALREAARITRAGELTGITLHSDGYANDPSPYSEHEAMESICKDVANSSAFVNTVAYRESSDFAFLSRIANLGSGRCVLAHSVKEAYDAIHDTSAVLNKAGVPTVVYPIKGADFLAFVSPTAKRVNGSDQDLKVAGLTKEDVGALYRYRKVSDSEYNRSSATEVQCGPAVYAFCAANLAAGRLNTAKYALVSTFDQDRAERHARALTNQQLAAMTQDVQGVLFGTASAPTAPSGPLDFGGRTTVLDVLRTLDEHSKDIQIDIEHLASVYQRRGVKRIPGTRDETGAIIKPPVDTEPLDKGRWLPLGSLEVNRGNATVNLKVSRPVRLIKVADGTPITEVAGIKLDSLKTFNAYTVVGDGELNLPSLKLSIGSQAATDAVRGLDGVDVILEVLAGNANAPHTQSSEVLINLSNLPITSYEFTKDVKSLGTVFDKIVDATVLSKILASVAKEESDTLTKEQVESLKQVCLSKNLYLNLPTTTEYADLKQALDDGTVDIRTSYRVEIGNGKLLGTGGMPSANAFADRWYEMFEKGTGTVADKATLVEFLNRGIGYRGKELSKRAKPAVTDGIMKPIFDDFLGIKSNGRVNRILADAGSTTLSALLSKGVPGILEAKRDVDGYIEDLYQEHIIPLVFFVGSTGLVPDSITATSQTADQVQPKYPDLKLDKDAREGTFFDLGGAILAVYAEKAYFSTGKQSVSTPITKVSTVQQPTKTPARPRTSRKAAALSRL